MTTSNGSRATTALPWLVLLYAAASLLHFAHNAEYLADYPNLPASFTRLKVYLTWCAIGTIGVLGYVLLQHGRRAAGLGVLAVYAALGFDGLLHYTRAPFATHTVMMNITIGLEALAAGVLLAAIGRIAVHRVVH